jgi:hypothetical protein
MELLVDRSSSEKTISDQCVALSGTGCYSLSRAIEHALANFALLFSNDHAQRFAERSLRLLAARSPRDDANLRDLDRA